MPKSSRRGNDIYFFPEDILAAAQFEHSVHVGDTQAVRKVIVRHKIIPTWLTPSLRYSALCRAVHHNDRTIVALLLKLRPVLEPEAVSEKTLSPLWAAVMNYQGEIVRLLVDAGANLHKRLGPNVAHDHDCTMLHYLAASHDYQQSYELIDLMIELGADVNAVDSTGETPLHYAVSMGDIGVASKLISKGADVNAKDVDWITPLLLACKSCSTKEIVKLLIENGADVLAQTPEECNALHLLASSSFEGPEKAEILLEQGVSLCTKDNENQFTPLHYAVMNGKEELTEIFLKRGADVNGWEGCCKLPLFYAAARRSPTIIKTLVVHGAEVKSKTMGGQTALHIACENMKEKNISALVRYGADINALDDKGDTPFSLIVPKNLSRPIQVMIRTIAKATVLNESTNEIDLGLIKKYPELEKFYDNCLNEIVKMKQLKLCDNVTYFSLFSKSPARLALLFRNRKIKDTLRVKEIKSLFPIYSGDFNNTIRVAKALKDDSYRIEHILNVAFCNNLPDPAIRQIMLNLLKLYTILREI